MNKYISTCIILIVAVLFSGCGSVKKIIYGNYAFSYTNNMGKEKNGVYQHDSLYVYETDKTFKAEIEDKTDYLIIKPAEGVKLTKIVLSQEIDTPAVSRIPIAGLLYSSESGFSEIKELKKYRKPFSYSDFKIALQTMTIPLRFRNAIGDGSVYPKQVETGINVGFAPVLKYTINIFDPYHKRMGKITNQYSFNAGLIFNLGAVDLNNTVNAPGLTVNRKAAMFTFGSFIALGINNINFGFALGCDNALGDGHEKWIYQNKMWTGVIVALDIIKP